MAGREDVRRALRVTGLALAGVAVAGAAAGLIIRDQVSRHRRDLFSPRPLRRLAALGYMSRQEATVDNVTLLRDFIAWEPRGLLRRRALAILDRMEREARDRGGGGEGAAG